MRLSEVVATSSTSGGELAPGAQTASACFMASRSIWAMAAGSAPSRRAVICSIILARSAAAWSPRPPAIAAKRCRAVSSWRMLSSYHA